MQVKGDAPQQGGAVGGAAGCNPCFSKAARTKASIGLRTHALPRTAAFRDAAQVAATTNRDRRGSSGPCESCPSHIAPSATHLRKVSICSLFNGFFGGISLDAVFVYSKLVPARMA